MAGEASGLYKERAREDRTNGLTAGQQAAGPYILQLSAGDEEATERRAHKSREIRVGSDRTVPISNGEICDCYLSFNRNGGFFFFFLSLLLLVFFSFFLLFFVFVFFLFRFFSIFLFCLS